jgi:hypothetical protein
VVSTADAGAKDEESRALAQALRAGLTSRVDAEHASWLAELTATLDVGRIVRALRLSSRPPKAGAPLPAEVAAQLTAGAGEALTAEAAPERWVAVLDALAFAPVRDKVIPASLPKELHPDVQATIARLATRIPKIAHIFEITPDRSAPRPKVERRRPPKPKLDKAKQAKPKQDKPTSDEPATDQPTSDTPKPATDADASTPAEAMSGKTATEQPEADTVADQPDPELATADVAAPAAPSHDGPASDEPKREDAVDQPEPAAPAADEPKPDETIAD